jgi:hypothetical protein
MGNGRTRRWTVEGSPASIEHCDVGLAIDDRL